MDKEEIDIIRQKIEKDMMDNPDKIKEALNTVKLIEQVTGPLITFIELVENSLGKEEANEIISSVAYSMMLMNRSVDEALEINSKIREFIIAVDQDVSKNG